MRWVIPIRSAESADVGLVGGKASNLRSLAAAGFPIPDGFCITTSAYRHSLNRAVVGCPDDVELRARIREAVLPATVRRAIGQAYDSLRGEEGRRRLAVRSSATGEDQASGSFAGQAESFLDVEGLETLLDRVQQCWASLFRPEGLLYGLRSDPSARPMEMGVVVQEMVPADAAGVLFTANPMSGDGREMVVSAAPGLGEAVVGGGAADTYYVEKASGRVTGRHLGEKREMATLGQENGIERVPVPPDQVTADTLSKAQLAELAELGRRVEAHFGQPQDIEWALRDERFYVLQARPVTTGGQGAAEARERPSVWSNANVGEALPGVGTPMTWSIARRFSRKGFEQAFGALGLTVPEEYEIVGSFRGRFYLNLSQFMSVASQIPFFPPERLLELAGGGGVRALAGTYDPRSPFAFMVHLPATLPKMAVSQLAAPAVALAWRRRFESFRERLRGERHSAKSPAQLLETLDRVTTVFNRTGTEMLACASNALSSYVAVLALVRRWAGDDGAGYERRLFVGLSSVQSAAPGFALLRIAREVQRHPEVARIVSEAPPDEVLDRLAGLPAARPVVTALHRFMEEHGQRAPREAELSTPRWNEDPSFLVRVLRTELRAARLPDPDAILRDQARARKEATAEVVQQIPLPVRPLFHTALLLAQNAARLRERMRTHVVETLGMYRTVLLEVGERLVAGGVAARVDDVFFLTMDEVREWLAYQGSRDAHRDWSDPQHLALRIAARRAEHAVFCAAPDPPSTFVLNAGRVEPTENPETAVSGPRLAGLGGSPGRVTGVARVIRQPGDGDRLGPGEILVAPYTDVGWTPMFLLAGGVVMDIGGPLSHSCVVAREYGIPAVVNVGSATTAIKDGQLITVDGDRGVVYLNAAEAGAESDVA